MKLSAIKRSSGVAVAAVSGSILTLFGLVWTVPVLAAACGTGGANWQLGTEPAKVQVLDSADNWNGGSACLKIGANGVDFTVQSQTVNTANVNPIGYPDTNLGCEGGFCTSTANQRQPLPGIFGTIIPKITAKWTGFAGGSDTKYDSLIDNQFSTDCNIADSNPTFDVNVAVYPDAVNNGTHGSYTAAGLANATTGPTFTDASGKVWYTKQQISPTGIHKTEFSAKVPVSSVSGKAMAQFYTWASRHGTGYMPAGECLRDLGVGYEPWTALPANTLGMSGVLIDP